MGAERPIRQGASSPAEFSVSTRSCRCFTSRRERRSLMADDSVANSFSLSQGLGMKSVAPALMARTAFSVSE